MPQVRVGHRVVSVPQEPYREQRRHPLGVDGDVFRMWREHALESQPENLVRGMGQDGEGGLRHPQNTRRYVPGHVLKGKP